jgi:ubiquinone/menaquinone biosynthesis C-methylase UbiE
VQTHTRTNEQLAAEFDRLALLTYQTHSGPERYYNFLEQRLPARLGNSLEVGCGSGSFSKVLATRSQSFLGVDLSSEMLRLAEGRLSDCANVEFVLGDFMAIDLEDRIFDCVVSIATLHHMPFEDAVERMRKVLRPGGVLILHDLLDDESLYERALSPVKGFLSMISRYERTGRFFADSVERKAWAEHGKGEEYLTFQKLRNLVNRELECATIYQHFFWRYTVVWVKS